MMRPENRAARQEEIARAAYEVLAEKGFVGLSMLAVAKRAKASNETLYRWFGDKTGLFAAMIGANAAEAKALLQTAIDSDADPIETLEALGATLLKLLTGDRAIALNRAAAADPTGELGALLSRLGRETVAPMITEVIQRGFEQGAFRGESPGTATRLYLDLLVGDLQIRRAIGAVPALSAEERDRRARLALDRLQHLLG